MTFFLWGSVTITKCHPCRLEPVGAWTATSMHSRMSSWGTGRSKSSRLRTERVVVRQVWASMAPIVARRRIHERLLHVIRCRRDLSRAARDSGLPQVPHRAGAEGAGPPPVPSLQGALSDRRRHPRAAHRRRQAGERSRLKPLSLTLPPEGGGDSSRTLEMAGVDRRLRAVHLLDRARYLVVGERVGLVG